VRNAQQVLVIIDACEAGSIMDSMNRLHQGTSTRPLPAGRDLSLSPAFQTMTATRHRSPAEASTGAGELSLYTRELLAILLDPGPGAPEMLAANWLHSKVAPAVIAASENHQAPSLGTPLSGTEEDGNFFFWNLEICRQANGKSAPRGPDDGVRASAVALPVFGPSLTVSLEVRRNPASRFRFASRTLVDQFGDVALDLQGASASNARLACAGAGAPPDSTTEWIPLAEESPGPRRCGAADIRILAFGGTRLLRVTPPEGAATK